MILDWYLTLCPFLLRFKTIKKLAEWSWYNPTKLSYWLENKMWYVADKKLKDEWQDPEVAFKKRESDCEEYATICYSAMKIWGWNPRIVCVYNNSVGHAVCVFGSKNKWCYIDHSGIQETEASSFEEVYKYISGFDNNSQWHESNIKGEPIIYVVGKDK